MGLISGTFLNFDTTESFEIKALRLIQQLLNTYTIKLSKM